MQLVNYQMPMPLERDSCQVMVLPRILLAAPHRLPFLAGCIGLVSALTWWLAVLAGWHSGSALLHAPMILLLGYAPFVFGFLLTVFPRWMGYSDLGRSRFGPVGIAIVLGVIATQIGLWTGEGLGLIAGFGLVGIGWVASLTVLGGLVARNQAEGKPPCWHAISGLIALVLGLLAVSLTLAFLRSGNAATWRWSHAVALGGFLLPVFLTVAHRMVPFFAGNAVQGYVRWRPDWLLAVLWGLLLARLAGILANLGLLAALAQTGLAAVTLMMAWKWWPRSTAPGLLWVLIVGFAWAPLGFALEAWGSLQSDPGLAPVHALTIGFCASLLVAMVTRVTRGHSGRPLAMHPLAWLAFSAVQAATIVRIIAGLNYEFLPMLLTASFILSVGIAPWLIRNAAIYMSPRVDGKPG